MEEFKNIGGAAGSFHTGFLRENMVGQLFKGSKVIDVTGKYIVTEDGKYLRKGLNINFKIIKPDARGYNSNRR
jgi:hypothetical protein